MGSRGGNIGGGGKIGRTTTTTSVETTTTKPARTFSRAVLIDAAENASKLQNLWTVALKQQPELSSQLLKILKKRHIIGVGDTQMHT